MGAYMAGGREPGMDQDPGQQLDRGVVATIVDAQRIVGTAINTRVLDLLSRLRGQRRTAAARTGLGENSHSALCHP